MKHLLLCVIALIIGITGKSQRYQFTDFSVADGLIDPFIYDMTQTNLGYLLIGTGEGLAKYDGNTIATYTINEGLNSNLINCLEHDSLTNSCYLGHNDGSVSRYSLGDIDALETDSSFTSKIQAIRVLNDGSIWALSQSQGFIVFNQSGRITKRINLPIEDIIAYDFVFFKDILLIASSEGIITCSQGEIKNNWNNYLVIDEDNSWTKFFVDKATNQLYGACENGIYSILSLGKDLVTRQLIKTEFGAPSSFFKNGDSFIIASRSGAYKYTIPSGNQYKLSETFDESKGLPTSYISSIFQDNTGNLWFGTYGEGLYLLIDQFFTFYKQEDPLAVNNTTCIFVGDSTKYFGVGKGVNVINTYKTPPYKILNSTYGLPSDQYSSIVEHNGIWFGSKSNGLYYAPDTAYRFKKVNLSNDLLSDYIYGISIFEDKVWVASESGVYAVNSATQKVDTSFNTGNGLRHNKVYGFLVDEDTIWMATISNYLTGISNNKLVEKKLEVGNNLLSVISLDKDSKGNIWLATLNNGVLQIAKDNTITNYASINGLLSDHCYALCVADNDNVWVGHRYGFSRIRSRANISIYDAHDGIDGEINLNAMHKDSLGNIWMGTTEGLIKYNPVDDIKKSNIPFVDLISTKINNDFYKDKYTFDLPYGKHEITFSFKGISLSNSNDLYFMYRLEGHDDNWTSTREGQAKYSNIRNGEYIFKLKVCNSDGDCREYENSLEINVDVPFWMKLWFIIVVAVVVVATVILIIRIRTNNLRRAQKELEYQLALRTKQIRDQKEIIEEKNKDITDSINYAKRIQTTMLPELDELRAKIDGVFVYYRPRDIVSGDFYWYKQYEDRLIFVVADCTGHGVPGAFMSLIGGVALKHICGVNKDLSAKDIMNNLNTEVSEILKQKISNEDDFTAIRDGMDILIAEYKLASKELSVASAKRPYFVKQDGELKRLNGDRMSIGGSVKKKEFTEASFKMNKGDAIYMFSDGYTDQFGGDSYKKIQLKGVYDLLNENLNLDTKNMHALVGKYFEDWIGDEEQIDDVLFMGIHF